MSWGARRVINKTGYRSGKLACLVRAVAKDLELPTCPTFHLLVCRRKNESSRLRWAGWITCNISEFSISLPRHFVQTAEVLDLLFMYLSWRKQPSRGGVPLPPSIPNYWDPILRKHGYTLLEYPTKKEIRKNEKQK